MGSRLLSLILLLQAASQLALHHRALAQTLQPPPGNSIFMNVKARGHQIYECKNSSDGMSIYSFLRAKAGLYPMETNDNNETMASQIGYHFFLKHPDGGQGRATWAFTQDVDLQSTVTGTVIFSQLNVAPDVPSLLLKATSHFGEGPLAKVSYIQRMEVQGGSAPPNCTEEGHVLKVFYRSHYVFWTQDDNIPNNTIPQLLPPQGGKPMFNLYCDGAQIYSFNGAAWDTLQGLTGTLSTIPGSEPQGTLTQEGQLLTWGLFNPPSSVTGMPIVTAFVDTNGLDWALFNATSHKGDGLNEVATVKFIQALSTRGGLPPAATVGFKKGDIQNSNFSAIFWFYS